MSGSGSEGPKTKESPDEVWTQCHGWSRAGCHDDQGRGDGLFSQAGFTPPTPAELAARFPDLEVMELLGHGGMGIVYKGRQPLLDRLVAIKVIRPDLHTDDAFQERFLREARTLAKLRHPFIVTVFDVCKAGDLYGLVMEYVEGASLRQLLAGGSITQRDALDFVPQITAALQHAHEAGGVHRDIKPENVLVDSRGRVRLVDFGLATLFGPGGVARGPTTTGWSARSATWLPNSSRCPRCRPPRRDLLHGCRLLRDARAELPGPDRVPPSRKAATRSPARPHRHPRDRARAGSSLPGGAPHASRHHRPDAHARIDDPHRKVHPRLTCAGVCGVDRPRPDGRLVCTLRRFRPDHRRGRSAGRGSVSHRDAVARSGGFQIRFRAILPGGGTPDLELHLGWERPHGRGRRPR